MGSAAGAGKFSVSEADEALVLARDVGAFGVCWTCLCVREILEKDFAAFLL
jgi:hypothetical protein